MCLKSIIVEKVDLSVFLVMVIANMLVAHRLKTIRNADWIFVLADGHIVQQGTHERLINQIGIYVQFINAHKSSYTKPSNSHAVSILKKGGFLSMDQEGYLSFYYSEKQMFPEELLFLI